MRRGTVWCTLGCWGVQEQHEDAKEAALESANNGGPETITVDNAGERLFTRCERETFVRFPRYSSTLHCTVLCYTVLFPMLLYSTVLYCAKRYCT